MYGNRSSCRPLNKAIMMLFDLELQPMAVFLAAIAVLFYMIIRKGFAGDGRRAGAKEPPQPPGALPVIGHLHLLRDRTSLAQILGSMAEKHGPVLMLRLGTRPTLVVSSSEAAKECFTTNDKAVSSRPRGAAGKHLGYDYAMFGFAPYGHHWRSARKIATSELLSNNRIDMFKHSCSIEIGACVAGLYRSWHDKGGSGTVTVEMKQRLGDMSYNIIVNLVAGKRYFGSSGVDSAEAWRFRKAVSEFFRLLTAFVPSDMFPFLSKIGVGLWGIEAAMKSAAREMDSVMKELLYEHREKRVAGADYVAVHRDFMDVMLSLAGTSTNFSPEMDPDKFIRATSLALMIGGTDTTTGSLAWALAALLNNPDVMKKVRDELDTVVGSDRVVEVADVKKLVYLAAAVKEAFRLYPRSQIMLPREFTEDCEVGGYSVPAGTQLLVNVWKLQRDPDVWGEDAGEYRPERFLSPSRHAGVEVRGHHLELIPFGSGRRVCPGISFAMPVMHLTLARLIQGFEMETPGRLPVDMTRVDLGMSMPGSTPLRVRLTPRLHCKLYESECA